MEELKTTSSSPSEGSITHRFIRYFITLSALGGLIFAGASFFSHNLHHAEDEMSQESHGSMSAQHIQSGQSANDHGHQAVVAHDLSATNITHRAAASGAWSDASTWESGNIPKMWAHVHIPEGVEVMVDGLIPHPNKTIHVDGTLSFAHDRNTELRVDTLYTSMNGQLIIGTKNEPIQAGITTNIIFADDGPISRETDSALLTRGAIIHGKTIIYGAEKTPFTTVSDYPRAGDINIVLSESPQGWSIGDSIVIAATDPEDPASDEKVTITAISGTTITIDRPLARDHVPPVAGLDVHVANLSRNITFSSENSDRLHRGHMMFMHTNDADVNYASFTDMGRTDKSKPLNDWQLLSFSEGSVGAENTEIEKLGGTNVRGRYSVHFHRGGVDKNGIQAIVNGTVVENDPGWAYVNHSSNVLFTDNISYNIVGAAYNTEAGDEIGGFYRNIALRTVNPKAGLFSAFSEMLSDDPLFGVDEFEEMGFDGMEPDDRVDQQDFGWHGDGFWFHGSGVEVKDNIVSGATGHAYIYWMLGLVEEGLGENMVDVANVPNGHLIGSPGTMIRTKHVPVPLFAQNDAYAVGKGLQIHYLHTDHRDGRDQEQLEEGILKTAVPQAYEDQLLSTFKDSTFWNVYVSGVEAPYTTRVVFDNITAYGVGNPSSAGIYLNHFSNENDLTIRNSTVMGFAFGIGAPRQGEGVIENVTLANQTDLLIMSPDRFSRDLEMRNIEFADLPSWVDARGAREQILLHEGSALQPPEELSILVSSDFDAEFMEEFEEFDENPEEILEEYRNEDFYGLGLRGALPNPLYLHDRITLTQPGRETVGLYFMQQTADFIPIPADSDFAQIADPRLVGLTNGEMMAQFGVSVGRAVAPAGVGTDTAVRNALIGTPRDPLPANTPFGGLSKSDIF